VAGLITHTGLAVQRSTAIVQCARCKTRGVIHHSVDEQQQQGLSCRYSHSTSVFKTKEIFRAMCNGSASRGKSYRVVVLTIHPYLSPNIKKE